MLETSVIDKKINERHEDVNDDGDEDTNLCSGHRDPSSWQWLPDVATVVDRGSRALRRALRLAIVHGQPRRERRVLDILADSFGFSPYLLGTSGLHVASGGGLFEARRVHALRWFALEIAAALLFLSKNILLEQDHPETQPTALNRHGSLGGGGETVHSSGQQTDEKVSPQSARCQEGGGQSAERLSSSPSTDVTTSASLVGNVSTTTLQRLRQFISEADQKRCFSLFCAIFGDSGSGGVSPSTREAAIAAVRVDTFTAIAALYPLLIPASATTPTPATKPCVELDGETAANGSIENEKEVDDDDDENDVASSAFFDPTKSQNTLADGLFTYHPTLFEPLRRFVAGTLNTLVCDRPDGVMALIRVLLFDDRIPDSFTIDAVRSIERVVLSPQCAGRSEETFRAVCGQIRVIMTRHFVVGSDSDDDDDENENEGEGQHAVSTGVDAPLIRSTKPTVAAEGDPPQQLQQQQQQEPPQKLSLFAQRLQAKMTASSRATLPPPPPSGTATESGGGIEGRKNNSKSGRSYKKGCRQEEKGALLDDTLEERLHMALVVLVEGLAAVRIQQTAGPPQPATPIHVVKTTAHTRTTITTSTASIPNTTGSVRYHPPTFALALLNRCLLGPLFVPLSLRREAAPEEIEAALHGLWALTHGSSLLLTTTTTSTTAAVTTTDQPHNQPQQQQHRRRVLLLVWDVVAQGFASLMAFCAQASKAVETAQKAALWPPSATTRPSEHTRTKSQLITVMATTSSSSATVEPSTSPCTSGQLPAAEVDESWLGCIDARFYRVLQHRVHNIASLLLGIPHCRCWLPSTSTRQTGRRQPQQQARPSAEEVHSPAVCVGDNMNPTLLRLDSPLLQWREHAFALGATAHAAGPLMVLSDSLRFVFFESLMASLGKWPSSSSLSASANSHSALHSSRVSALFLPPLLPPQPHTSPPPIPASGAANAAAAVSSRPQTLSSGLCCFAFSAADGRLCVTAGHRHQTDNSCSAPSPKAVGGAGDGGVGDDDVIGVFVAHWISTRMSSSATNAARRSGRTKGGSSFEKALFEHLLESVSALLRLHADGPANPAEAAILYQLRLLDALLFPPPMDHSGINGANAHIAQLADSQLQPLHHDQPNTSDRLFALLGLQSLAEQSTVLSSSNNKSSGVGSSGAHRGLLAEMATVVARLASLGDIGHRVGTAINALHPGKDNPHKEHVSGSRPAADSTVSVSAAAAERLTATAVTLYHHLKKGLLVMAVPTIQSQLLTLLHEAQSQRRRGRGSDERLQKKKVIKEHTYEASVAETREEIAALVSVCSRIITSAKTLHRLSKNEEDEEEESCEDASEEHDDEVSDNHNMDCHSTSSSSNEDDHDDDGGERGHVASSSSSSNRKSDIQKGIEKRIARLVATASAWLSSTTSSDKAHSSMDTPVPSSTISPENDVFLHTIQQTRRILRSMLAAAVVVEERSPQRQEFKKDSADHDAEDEQYDCDDDSKDTRLRDCLQQLRSMDRLSQEGVQALAVGARASAAVACRALLAALRTFADTHPTFGDPLTNTISYTTSSVGKDPHHALSALSSRVLRAVAVFALKVLAATSHDRQQPSPPDSNSSNSSNSSSAPNRVGALGAATCATDLFLITSAVQILALQLLQRLDGHHIPPQRPGSWVAATIKEGLCLAADVTTNGNYLTNSNTNTSLTSATTIATIVAAVPVPRRPGFALLLLEVLVAVCDYDGKGSATMKMIDDAVRSSIFPTQTASTSSTIPSSTIWRLADLLVAVAERHCGGHHHTNSSSNGKDGGNGSGDARLLVSSLHILGSVVVRLQPRVTLQWLLDVCIRFFKHVPPIPLMARAACSASVVVLVADLLASSSSDSDANVSCSGGSGNNSVSVPPLSSDLEGLAQLATFARGLVAYRPSVFNPPQQVSSAISVQSSLQFPSPSAALDDAAAHHVEVIRHHGLLIHALVDAARRSTIGSADAIVDAVTEDYVRHAQEDQEGAAGGNGTRGSVLDYLLRRGRIGRSDPASAAVAKLLRKAHHAEKRRIAHHALSSLPQDVQSAMRDAVSKTMTAPAADQSLNF